MAKLQIRQMPDALDQQLVFRAEQVHRRLNQQAVAELQQALGASVDAQRIGKHFMEVDAVGGLAHGYGVDALRRGFASG